MKEIFKNFFHCPLQIIFDTFSIDTISIVKYELFETSKL